MSNLESQVEELTRELNELRSKTQGRSVDREEALPQLEALSSPPGAHELGRYIKPPPTASSDGVSSHYHDLVQSVKNVAVEPSRQPRFLGEGSGIMLARLVMAAIRADSLPSALFSEHRPYDPSFSTHTAEASLPPRHVAEHLVGVYFQYRTPHLPILERAQVEAAVERAFRSIGEHQWPSGEIGRDIFTVYMVFAIALYDVPNPSGGRPSQSEGCFRSAMSMAENVITYSKSDMETLVSVLLLAQFVALCPSRGSLWHLTGIALRLAVDIGLHWETQGLCQDMDPDSLNERRRLWYSTYQLDRVLCITLGRPFGIIDESMRVQLPSPGSRQRTVHHEMHEFDMHNQRAYNHLFAMSKLESEIKHVQHSQSWSLTIAYPRPDYPAWLQDILPRLQEWYATIPPLSKAHQSSIFAYRAYWDVIYNNSIILLYRPNSAVQHPAADALSASFDACCNLISSMKILQREGKIDIPWKSVHHLFIAGLGVIYSLWYSAEIRHQSSVKSSIFTLQSCSSTLSALSEVFPGASGCRDAFEALSTATIDWLLSNDDDGIGENRGEFERQANDLLQLLQPSRGATMATNGTGGLALSEMLASDNFALSEMLSSVAQWPDFSDLSFAEMNA